MFGDRVREHFFGDGLLTPARTAAMYQARMAEVGAAIRGESARWGDNSATTPYTRSNWLATQNGLLTSYFPTRTATVLSQLRSAGLYPSVNAPNFAAPPGEVPSGSALAITDPNSPTGSIFYTIDGSEPSIPASVQTTVLLPEFSPARAFVPTSTNGGSGLGLTWTQRAFNDGSWTSGNAGVGYDTNTSGVNYLPSIGINVQAQMSGLTSTVYIRTKFNVGDPDDYDSLTLQMKYDDGFVAYLNGTLVARAFAPTTVAWNSQSSGGNGDANALTFQNFDISAFRTALVAGENVLAIHGLNDGNTSSDLLMLPQLVAGSSLTSGVSPTAIPYTGPVVLDATTTIKARVRRGTEWSALTQGFYSVDVPIRVSEIYYNPPGAGELTEYIGLENISANPVDLTGVRFTAGIAYEFLPTDAVRVVPPGGRIVVVHDRDAFAAAFENVPPSVIADRPFVGSLDNGGESIELTDAGGAVILSFRYDDAWHPMTDGDGYSLVRVDTTGAKADWSVDSAWRASYTVGGTPGSGDVLFGDLDGDLRVGLGDLIVIQANLGMAVGASFANGDLNGDGAVDRADVAMLAANYGRSAAVGSPAASAVVARRLPTEIGDREPMRVRAVRRSANAPGGERPMVPDAVDAAMAQADGASGESRLSARRGRLRR